MRLDPETLQELLAYHYDRRERVYDFASGFTEEEFVREMNVGWGSVRGILVHCLEAEAYWIQCGVRKGKRPIYPFGDYPDIAAVRRLAAEERERTERFLAGVTQAELAREYSNTYSDGTVVRFTLAKALLHIITHDTHHRAQVLTLGRQLGYVPPEIDLM